MLQGENGLPDYLLVVTDSVAKGQGPGLVSVLLYFADLNSANGTISGAGCGENLLHA